ncbi:MAG: hypothetical protein HDR25_01250 [Lachnospiraceae bacterium]|nr:hypothetical protein [Lachnospiraceae bacterium]
MNIGTINSNPYFTFSIRNNKNVPNPVGFQKNAQSGDIAVTLDISKEGRELLKNETIKNMSYSYEDVLQQRKYLGNVVMDGGRFQSKLNDLENSGVCTEQDWVDSCVDTYKTLYDEIVSGYANGTREKYVSDENSKDGLRKLTMAEELQMLNDEYDSQCDFLERFFERSKWEHKHVLEFAKLQDKIRKDRSQSMYRAMVSSYEDFKSKQIPGGVRNAMMNAVAAFRNPSINIVV